jgi:hypothetical protein
MARNSKRPIKKSVVGRDTNNGTKKVAQFIKQRPHIFRAAVQGGCQLLAYFGARYYQKDPSPYLIAAGIVGMGVSELVIDKMK